MGYSGAMLYDQHGKPATESAILAEAGRISSARRKRCGPLPALSSGAAEHINELLQGGKSLAAIQRDHYPGHTYRQVQLAYQRRYLKG